MPQETRSSEVEPAALSTATPEAPLLRLRRAVNGISNRLVTIPFAWLAAIVVVVHILLSLWAVWINQINNDGITYVVAARLFAAGETAQALATYRWPAYSILIAVISRVTTFDALVAAHILNTATTAATALIFITMVHRHTANRAIVLAAIVLLFANHSFNVLRGAIVRDHLFLLLLLIGVWCQLRDCRDPNLRDKAGFIGCSLAAALFRVEALAFLVLIPLLRMFFECRNSRRRVVIFTITCLVVAAAPLGLAAWFRFNPFTEMHHLLSDATNRIDTLRSDVLAPFAGGRAVLAYMSIVVALTAAGLIKGIGLLNGALSAGGAWIWKDVQRSDFFYLAMLYLAVGAIIALTQVFVHIVYDPPRHAAILALVFTLPASLALVEAFAWSKTAQPRALATVVAAVIIGLMAFGLFGGLRFYDPNRFVYTAVDWLKTNVPADTRVLSNNNQILFYGGFGGYEPTIVLAVGSAKSLEGLMDWQQYDLVVLHLRRSRLVLAEELEDDLGEPIKTFENARGDQILVFKPLR